MNSQIFRKTLVAGAVAAACAVPTLGFAGFTATNIQFDRDGTGPSAPIIISGIDWRPGTLLANDLMTSTADGLTVSTTPNNFTLYGQGQVSQFSGPALGMPGGTPPQELTYEFAVPMTPTFFIPEPTEVTSGGNTFTVQPQINAALDTTTAGALNFFKIWYSDTGGVDANNQSTGAFGGNSESRSGTGFGAPSTQSDPCGTSGVTSGGEILVFCGVVINEPPAEGTGQTTWSFTRNSNSTFVPLDAAGNGIDNYDGIPDDPDGVGGAPAIPDPTAIGSFAGTGSGQLLVQAVYANTDFFVNTMFDRFVVDLKHTEASNLNFTNQTPYASVVGQTWDVGTDSGLVGTTSRVINNLVCLDSSAAAGSTTTCDAVFEGDGASTFQAYVVPEPGSLALLGLGMLGLGAVMRRRRIGQL